MSLDVDVVGPVGGDQQVFSVGPADSASVRLIGMATAATICVTYVVIRPPSQDFAAGHFRAELASRGAFLWNNLWFGGHPLPGYGVVAPLLGGAFGVVPVAVASVLVATWCFVLLVERWPDLRDPKVGVALFACGCGVNLWGGRLTFLPAVMFGVMASVALQRRRPWLVAVCAALSGLSSPLGAMSLVVIAAAAWFAKSAPRRLLVITAVAAVAPIGALMMMFPEGGWFPFTAGGFLLLVGALVAAGWCGRAVPLVRWFVVVYGVVAIGAFVIRSPLGGNAVRLAWLVAGPIAVLTLWSRRRVVIPLIVIGSVVWNLAYISMAFGAPDRTASDNYYDPLVSYVRSLSGPVRIEVVPTQTFAQADTLALRVDGIARGWETQLDRTLNPEFYTGRLDAESYHRWLLEHAVSIVALPLGRLRDTSLDEAAVIRSRPSYLREVWTTADWNVYSVVGATPLADNGTKVIDVQPDELTIDAARTGWTTLRFRFTDLYRVSEGAACLEPTSDGWMRVFVERPGRIRLTIAFSLDAVVHRGTASCSL